MNLKMWEPNPNELGVPINMWSKSMVAMVPNANEGPANGHPVRLFFRIVKQIIMATGLVLKDYQVE